MIITRKALPRRTFLKAVGATMALPLLDAMIPAATALKKNGRKTGSPPRFRFHADGLRSIALDPAQRQNPGRAIADFALSRAGPRACDGANEYGAGQCLSRLACDFEFLVPERGQGQAHGRERLLS